MTIGEKFDWLTKVWRKAAEGDSDALAELLIYITVKGREQLTRHIRWDPKVRSGMTTQILTLASEKVWKKADKKTLEWPEKSAYKLLLTYLFYSGKEVRRKNRSLGTPLEQMEEGLESELPHEVGESERALTQKREPDPEGDADLEFLKGQLQKLESALGDLSETDAEILRWKMAGLSDKETAAKMGISWDALRQRLRRLRPVLIKLLDEDSAA